MNTFFCGRNSGGLEVFCVKSAKHNLYKCDVIQLLKKEGTEKYLFRGSVFCVYQGTVPLSTGCSLFGFLCLASVGNRFMFGTAGTIPRGSDAKETFF